MEKLHDPVNHPSHYTDGKYEVIDFIESHGLGFHLGNAVKYISRAGKKNKDKEIEDLNKAIWYLERAKKAPFTKAINPSAKKEDISASDFSDDKCLPRRLKLAIINLVYGENLNDLQLAIHHVEEHIKKLEETKNEQSA